MCRFLNAGDEGAAVSWAIAASVNRARCTGDAEPVSREGARSNGRTSVAPARTRGVLGAPRTGFTTGLPLLPEPAGLREPAPLKIRGGGAAPAGGAAGVPVTMAHLLSLCRGMIRYEVRYSALRPARSGSPHAGPARPG